MSREQKGQSRSPAPWFLGALMLLLVVTGAITSYAPLQDWWFRYDDAQVVYSILDLIDTARPIVLASGDVARWHLTVQVEPDTPEYERLVEVLSGTYRRARPSLTRRVTENGIPSPTVYQDGVAVMRICWLRFVEVRQNDGTYEGYELDGPSCALLPKFIDDAPYDLKKMVPADD